METETIEVGRQKKGLPIDDLGRRRRGHYDGPQIDNYDKFCECRHAFLCFYCILKTMSFDKPEFLDSNLWAKYKPLPVEIKTGSVYDYYDVYEEIGM